VLAELRREDEARARIRDALAISNAMHDRHGILHELALLAEVAAAEGHRRLAGTLYGAIEAETARAPVGRWIHAWSPAGTEYAELGDPEVETGRAEGRELELAAAVALALGEEAPPT
jgi:hypothetical protein